MSTATENLLGDAFVTVAILVQAGVVFLVIRLLLIKNFPEKFSKKK